MILLFYYFYRLLSWIDWHRCWWKESSWRDPYEKKMNDVFRFQALWQCIEKWENKNEIKWACHHYHQTMRDVLCLQPRDWFQKSIGKLVMDLVRRLSVTKNATRNAYNFKNSKLEKFQPIPNLAVTFHSTIESMGVLLFHTLPSNPAPPRVHL